MISNPVKVNTIFSLLPILLILSQSAYSKMESTNVYTKSIRKVDSNRVQLNQVTDPIPLPVNGGTVQSSITNTERVIVFIFSPPEDGLYVIETFPGFFGDAVDTYIALFVPDDPSIFIKDDDDDGDGELSLILHKLEGGKVYFLTVESFDGMETGPFQVEVRSQPSVDILDSNLSVSVYAENLPIEPAAITVNNDDGSLYVTAPFTDGELWVVRLGEEVELVREFFSNVTATNKFYSFLSADIQFFNGTVFTTLTDGINGEVIGINAGTGDTRIYIAQDGLGFEAGMDVLNNQLIVSDGEGSADTVTVFDFAMGSQTLLARGEANSEINALEVAQNTQTLYGLDGVNGLLQIQQQSILSTANGLILDEYGYFAVDPNGEFFYYVEGEKLNRVSVSTGDIEILIQDFPFPNGDLTFGPSSGGSGQSLYVPAQNRIIEVAGFDFQVNTQPTPPPLPTPQPRPTPTPNPNQGLQEILVNSPLLNSELQTPEGVWFSFRTSVDGVYLIQTETGNNSNVDPVMELFGPNNQTDFIAGNDDLDQSTLNPRITFFLQGSSSYFVRVFPFEDMNTGVVPVFGLFSIFLLGPDVDGHAAPSRELLTRFEFGENSLADAQWNELPGGFGGFEPGRVSLGGLPSGLFVNSSDNRGLTINVNREADGDDQLVFLNSIASFDSGGKPLLLKMSARADGPNASVFLAALKGNLLTSEMVDGSLGINQLSRTVALQAEPKEIMLVYQPVENSVVNPIIQVVNSGVGNTTVWVDWLEVYRYDDEGLF